PALATDLTENQRNEGNRYGKLRETCEVIAVHIGTKRNAAIAHLAEPIEFSVEGQMLEYSETSDEEGQQHAEPEKSSPVLQRAKRLRRKEHENYIGDQQLEFESRGVGRGRAAKEKLHRDYRGDRDERRQNAWNNDFLFTVDQKKQRPK